MDRSRNFISTSTVLVTIPNLLVVLSLVLETFLVCTLALRAELTWLQGSKLKSIVNFQISDSTHNVEYVWISLMVLWCGYCAIYLCRMAPTITGKLKAVGEAIMMPSVAYLRIIGTLGIVPLVGQTFSYYPCAFIPEHNSAYIQRHCKIECFSHDHNVLILISSICLVFFIPSSLLTAHFWQDIDFVKKDSRGQKVMTIYFRRGYILGFQIALYVLIVCNGLSLRVSIYLSWNISYDMDFNLVVSFQAWLCCECPLDRCFPCWTAYNGYYSGLIALVSHAVHVEDAWPIGLILFAALGTLVGAYFRAAKKCVNFFSKKW